MADAVGTVEKIIKVAFMIKEAVDKVRKNKEECREIRKRVVRVSALLTRLQETEMMEDPATGSALKELEQTLTVALELVTACRQKNVLSHFCTAGDLAKQLREVKQDISDLMVDGIFATNVNATIILTNIQLAACAPPQKDAGVVNLRSSHTTDSDRSHVMNSEMNNVPAGSELSAIPFPAGLKKFSLRELKIATNSFSKKNIVEDGASTVIYKGALHDGLVVAIKKFRDSVGFSEARFYDELNLVPKLQHICVAKLVGYCHEVTVSLQWSGGKYVGVQERHCFFIEEYMPNGSLETIITGMCFTPRLKFLLYVLSLSSQLSPHHLYFAGLQCQWSSRFQIIQGIANSLRYLHEQHVVHSDLKPSNILLDHNMNPKINDFGIARILDHDGDLTTRDVNYLAGTMGYMPPEYIIEGILSTKYDIYSFGVILLETIGSMCDVIYRRQASVDWAWEVRDAESIGQFFHRSLCHLTELEQIRRCIEIGLLCTQLKPANRPTMADILEMLNGTQELPIPKKPRYTKQMLPMPQITSEADKSRTY